MHGGRVGWTVEGEFPLFLSFLLAAGGGGGTFHLSKSPSLPLSPYSEVSFAPPNPAGESPITMHNGVPKYYYLCVLGEFLRSTQDTKREGGEEKGRRRRKIESHFFRPF